MKHIVLNYIIIFLLCTCIAISSVALIKSHVIQGEQGIQGIQGEQGETGEQGIQGVAGIDGADGQDGEDGIGIKSFTFYQAYAHYSTYKITYTDGTTSYINVNTVQGEDGEDGATPYIDADGYWCVGDTCTGVKATGDTGVDGKDGVSITSTNINDDGHLIITYSNGQVDDLGCVVGKDGKDATACISSDGYWIINNTDTGIYTKTDIIKTYIVGENCKSFAVYYGVNCVKSCLDGDTLIDTGEIVKVHYHISNISGETYERTIQLNSACQYKIELYNN